ncbi:MAG: aminotransferase [Bauldia sp.]
MKPTNPVFTGMPTTVFEVMSGLAREHNAINLGQGFPDTDGALAVRQSAAQALLAGPNQYPPMMGVPELRQAVAEANQRFYGLAVDWRSEVLVTSGATEALADCLFGILAPGDEVVLIEPLYDSYLPIVRQAGATARLVRLTPPHWHLDRAALAAAFGAKTKAIVLNSPMNPAAKVFSDEELAAIAELCVRHDAYAICDEVYEHIAFDGRRHRPLMTFPGMRERTARIGSAGKTLSLTGWKIGYVTAAPKLLEPIAKAHQFNTFTTPPNLQQAAAVGLRQGDDYFAGLAADLAGKRDRLAAGLARLGFGVAASAGTYFIVTDVTPLGLAGDDFTLCKRMTVEAGVAAIPVSAFYASAPPTNFVRFCFSKQPAVLDAALARLEAWLAKTARRVA